MRLDVDDYSNHEGSENTENEFVTKNAKLFLNDIKEFKKRSSEEGNDQLRKQLDLHFPTTLLTSTKGKLKIFSYGFPKDYIPKNNPQWVEDDPVDKDLYSTLTLSQRLSNSRLNTSRLSIARNREDGIEGNPIFSTYSKTQIKFLKKLNGQFSLNHQKISRSLFRYLKNPLLNHQFYQPIRDQIWSHYLAFSPQDTLTKLWSEHGRSLVKKFESDTFAQEYIKRVYQNELKIIDRWEIVSEPFQIPNRTLEESRKTIQQILRGYATYVVILISQKRVRSIPPPAEFKFGMFKYPTQGFQDGKDGEDLSDLYELSQYSEALRLGVIDLTECNDLIFNCIGRRLLAFRDGELISSLKETGEVHIFAELESSPIKEKIELAKIIEGSSIYEAAKRKKLVGFYKQSKILKSQKALKKTEVLDEKYHHR